MTLTLLVLYAIGMWVFTVQLFHRLIVDEPSSELDIAFLFFFVPLSLIAALIWPLILLGGWIYITVLSPWADSINKKGRGNDERTQIWPTDLSD